MKRCPKCSGLMPDDVTRCVRCGFDSAKAASSTAAASKPAAAAPIPGQAKKGRIRNGWALAKQSWRVLMLDKELLVFPLLSGFACFLVLASFLGGAWASGVTERHDAAGDISSWLMLFAYYFITYFVIVFFNSALVACAMIRFRGGDPTVRDGLRAAGERLSQIVAWALLAATVGVLLRMIEERVQFVGKIVTALLGAAWTMAAYFVVPVLVVEKLGPVDAFKRSISILKKAWGESIVSNVGLGAVTFIVTLLVLIPTVIAFAVIAVKMSSLAVAIVGFVVVVVLLVIAALVGSALNSIALSALYLYATEDKVPEAFAGARLRDAFAARS